MLKPVLVDGLKYRCTAAELKRKYLETSVLFCMQMSYIQVNEISLCTEICMNSYKETSSTLPLISHFK